MKVSTVVYIGFRLFAIWWLVMTLPTTFDTISALLVTGPDPFGVPASHAFRWLSLLSYPVLGAMAWFGAGLLVEKTVRTQDASLTVHHLGPEQVYSFGLLILGGYFCLPILAPWRDGCIISLSTNRAIRCSRSRAPTHTESSTRATM